jgi:hypothetical protein
VRAVRVRVADALDDGDLVLLEELLADLLEGRVQAQFVVDLDDLGRLNAEGRAELVVQVVAVRDDGVEPVVAAGHLDDDQDGVLARLGGPGGALDESGDDGTGGDQGGALEKLAAT